MAEIFLWMVILFAFLIMLGFYVIGIFLKNPVFLYGLSFINCLLFFISVLVAILTFKDAKSVHPIIPFLLVLFTLFFLGCAIVEFYNAHKIISFKIRYFVYPIIPIIMIFCIVNLINKHLEKESNSLQEELYISIDKKDMKKFKKIWLNNNSLSLDKIIKKGNKEDIEFLLSLDIDLENYKREIISYAMDQGNVDTLKLLIDKDIVDVNAKYDLGLSLLHYATEYEGKEIAELLIVKGADVNAKDMDGSTPLHFAYRNKDVAKLLIANGSDVNAKNNKGMTPLHYLYENKEIVELLIAKGADVNAKDNEGKTALDYAEDEDLEDLLIKYGAKSGKDLK